MISCENKPDDPRQALRARIRARRDALSSADRAAFDEKILLHISSLSSWKNADSILLYMSMGSEAGTEEIFRAALREKKKVYCPVSFPRRVITEENGGQRKEAGVMEFFRVQHPEELRSGRHGIREPDPNTAVPYRYDSSGAALIIVPGIAFDLHGGRIGWGGGYYDRFLALHPDIPTAAIAYECQLVQAVPMDSHDVRLRAICTERRIIRTDLL